MEFKKSPTGSVGSFRLILTGAQNGSRRRNEYRRDAWLLGVRCAAHGGEFCQVAGPCSVKVASVAFAAWADCKFSGVQFPSASSPARENGPRAELFFCLAPAQLIVDGGR